MLYCLTSNRLTHINILYCLRLMDPRIIVYVTGLHFLWATCGTLLRLATPTAKCSHKQYDILDVHFFFVGSSSEVVLLVHSPLINHVDCLLVPTAFVRPTCACLSLWLQVPRLMSTLPPSRVTALNPEIHRGYALHWPSILREMVYSSCNYALFKGVSNT